MNAAEYTPSLFLGQQSGGRHRERSLSSGGGGTSPLGSQTSLAGTPRVGTTGSAVGISAYRSGSLRHRSKMSSRQSQMEDMTPRQDVPHPNAPPTEFLMRELDGMASQHRDMSLADASIGTSGWETPAPEDEGLSSWIVVYGLDEATRRDPTSVLRALWNYGDVVDHEPGRGNWLFVRFASRWHAEKALAQATFLLDGGQSLVGALRVTPDVALRFGLRVSPEGASLNPQPFQSAPNFALLRAPVYAHTPEAVRAPAVGQPRPQPPTKQRSLCARLMAYIFSW